jgi:protein MpaA
VTVGEEEVPLGARGRVEHPDAVVGHSRDGVALRAYGLLEPGTPLVFAAIHGSEPESTIVLSAALRTLPVGTPRCAVVLALNPDGLLRGTRGNAAGVDLNRNFPAADWKARTVIHHWTGEQGIPATTLELPRLTTDEGKRVYAPLLAEVLRGRLP